jgi:Amt family ammonium transporter
MGVTTDFAGRQTFSVGVTSRAHLHLLPATFAAITPALIVGAFAERMKFSPFALFIPLWGDLHLLPDRAHGLVLGRPDAIARAAKALAAATDEATKKTAQDALDAGDGDAGQVFLWGAIDFAGGTVVHINAGIAGLMGAFLVGKRTGFGKELMPPHSLTMTMIGACLLWVRLVRLQCGLEPRSHRHRRARHDQHLRRHGGGGVVVDVRGMDREG